MSEITACDVAGYILEKLGPMSAMKLQKLVYYAQAWSLVWDDEPLFNSRIEAWVDGPVVTSLYELHRGKYTVDAHTFDDHISHDLTLEQQDTVNAVIDAYGHKSAQWLSDKTHSEAPWMNARCGLHDNERCTQEITQNDITAYYSTITQNGTEDKDDDSLVGSIVFQHNIVDPIDTVWDAMR